MEERPRYTIHGLLLVAVLVTGCVGTDKALHYIGDAPLSYYKDVDQQIEYPDVQSANRPEVANTLAPRTIAAAYKRPLEQRKNDILDLSLQDAIHIALANNRVIRSSGTFLSRGNPLYAGEAAPSVYDPAIANSGVLFGRRGVEAALSDFDTQFATSMFWGRSENVQNNIFFGGGLRPGATLQRDTGTFQAALSKTFADGGSVQLANNWNYLYQNVPGQLFPSVYTGNVGVQYTRPLWAGSGVEFTRIAGPARPNFGSITGVSQGVVIARINTDITLADFEADVRGLVRDVEDLYWDLYLQYRLYHTAVVAREATRAAWEKAKNLDEIGGIAGSQKQDEPQAREQYFAAKAAAEKALSDLYTAETRLRRLLGLAVNATVPPPVAEAKNEYPDGYIIRPKDAPVMTELVPDWRMSLTSALTERLELRKQKWNIKSLELQLRAARSLTNPQLSFVSGYQVNGFGDQLFGKKDDDQAGTAQGLRSAWETITQGNQTSWNLGFQFSMPIGFRSARAQVRNLELRLQKAQHVLGAQELEVSHELAVAFQNLALHHANVKSNFERVRAAERRTNILRGQYLEGLAGVTVDIVLRAVADRAEDEAAFYASVASYNKAIAELEFRKGTLLEYNNVFLAEDEWTPKAYEQALRRAWARSHALDNDRMLHTEPEEIVPPPQRYDRFGPQATPDGATPAVPPPAPAKPAAPVEPVAPKPADAMGPAPALGTVKLAPTSE